MDNKFNLNKYFYSNFYFNMPYEFSKGEKESSVTGAGSLKLNKLWIFFMMYQINEMRQKR